MRINDKPSIIWGHVCCDRTAEVRTGKAERESWVRYVTKRLKLESNPQPLQGNHPQEMAHTSTTNLLSPESLVAQLSARFIPNS